MKALWGDEPAEYHGEFVDFAPAHSAPPPVQRPHPPIHVAGSAPHALKRVARYGDGWLPILGREKADFRDRVRELRDLVREAWRDPDRIEISLYACPAEEETLRRYDGAGVARAIFALPAAPVSDVLSLLDDRTRLIAKIS